MKTVNQVHESSDYSLFKTLTGNRNVNKLHVKRLKHSFKEKYLLSPIIVNEKYQIIDGQHRFEAAKELNLPIYFIIAYNYGLSEVQMLNENMKNWKKEDYLNAYCDLKYPEYLKFRNFMNQFPCFGIDASSIILTDRPSLDYSLQDKSLITDTNKRGHFHIRYFQEGCLVIPDYNKSIENAKKILMLKHYYDGYNRKSLVGALIGIFKIEYYNHDRLIERLKSNPNGLKHCANVTQYKLLIEDIYNFRSREKVSLRF